MGTEVVAGGIQQVGEQTDDAVSGVRVASVEVSRSMRRGMSVRRRRWRRASSAS